MSTSLPHPLSAAQTFAAKSAAVLAWACGNGRVGQQNSLRRDKLNKRNSRNKLNTRNSRFGRPTTTLIDPSSGRVEVCPPSLRHVPADDAQGGAWQRVLFWLLAPAPQTASPGASRLPAVRNDFLATLTDIDGGDATRLRDRIHDTHSLRELWHLRAEVFRVVGLAHSQSQAEARLTQLNRHFPTRSPRAQFAPLV